MEMDNCQMCCRHCKGFRNINWRCMTCDSTLCDDCKANHLQMPSVTDHVIVSVDIFHTRTEDLVKKMTCKIHPRQAYNCFCETCDFLVCSDCSLNHFGHNKIKIEQFVRENFEGRKTYGTSDERTCIDAMPDCAETEAGKDSNVQEDDQQHNNDHYDHLEDSFCFLQADLKLVHTVVTNLSTINFIVSASQDEAWIGGTDGNIIMKIDVNKTFFGKTLMRSKSKQIDQIEGFQPLDISLNANGDILFVCRFDKCIKIVKTDYHGQKQICDYQNFSPLEPICIHCSKTGDQYMWIGLTEGGPDFELSPKSTRQVVEISVTGEVCNIYEFTKANKRLFTLPWRVINTDNGICVIDRLDQHHGRLISLNKSGHLMWIYKDPHPSFSQKAFLPTDLVVTSTKYIIISDFANSALHVLNEDGTLMYQPYLINLKIEQPLSLNIDIFSKNLWIGTTSDSISNDKKAKIYEIEMTGL